VGWAPASGKSETKVGAETYNWNRREAAQQKTKSRRRFDLQRERTGGDWAWAANLKKHGCNPGEGGAQRWPMRKGNDGKKVLIKGGG